MQRKVTSTANARFALHCAHESSGMSLSQNFCSVFSTLPTLSHLPQLCGNLCHHVQSDVPTKVQQTVGDSMLLP